MGLHNRGDAARHGLEQLGHIICLRHFIARHAYAVPQRVPAVIMVHRQLAQQALPEVLGDVQIRELCWPIQEWDVLLFEESFCLF